MSNVAPILDIPTDPRVRQAWISFQLKVRGLSLRQLAKRLRCSPQALSFVAGGATAAKLEEALAQAIDLTPQQLFPEHYDKAGRRIPRTRELKRRGRGAGCNVKSGEAA